QVPGEAGTLSAEVAAAQEDLGEEELGMRDARLGVELSGAWRRLLLRDVAWARAEVRVRSPGSSPVHGGRLGLELRGLPLALQLRMEGEAFTQELRSGRATAVRGRFSLTRPFDLGPRLQLRPSVHLAVDRAWVPPRAFPDVFDQLVRNSFSELYPLRESARLGLRWTPLQDFVGTSAAGVTFTHAPWGVEYLDWRTAAQALLPIRALPVRAGLGYRASVWAVTPERALAYLRHDLEGGVDASVWTGTMGRFAVVTRARASLAQPFGLRSLVWLGVRYDWSDGRGIQDFAPGEETFDLDVARRYWETEQ
ncbi:MAG TPA: hypothetical protein VK420_16880, partial [Longimicrobium sp.]|nr:hypothetical protein [Longimicrobium sp.]